jgi:hypothetical protein
MQLCGIWLARRRGLDLLRRWWPLDSTTAVVVRTAGALYQDEASVAEPELK